MPARLHDDINTMPAKPSPYGDRVAQAAVFLIGVGVVGLVFVYR